MFDLDANHTAKCEPARCLIFKTTGSKARGRQQRENSHGNAKIGAQRSHGLRHGTGLYWAFLKPDRKRCGVPRRCIRLPRCKPNTRCGAASRKTRFSPPAANSGSALWPMWRMGNLDVFILRSGLCTAPWAKGGTWVMTRYRRACSTRRECRSYRVVGERNVPGKRPP